ncbi:MAG: phosphate uptake regulator PhoU [Fervidobacterium sp.]|nr:phosphate uptake regulator PhoU [Fervidobacterium sp.]
MKWLTKDNVEELKKLIIKEGWYVEDLLRITAEAFKERNIELAKQVEDEYWDVYNEYLEILNYSQVIVGLCNPNGYDLRFVFGSALISKILLDIGKRLKDIVFDIKQLVREPELNQSVMLPEMFSFSQKILRRALRIYVDQNLEGASGVCSQDSIIDGMFAKFNDDIIKIIQDNPRLVRRALLLMDISKALEELSDFSVQIIEVTYYILTGKYHTCYNDLLQPFSIEIFKAK